MWAFCSFFGLFTPNEKGKRTAKRKETTIKKSHNECHRYLKWCTWMLNQFSGFCWVHPIGVYLIRKKNPNRTANSLALSFVFLTVSAVAAIFFFCCFWFLFRVLLFFCLVCLTTALNVSHNGANRRKFNRNSIWKQTTKIRINATIYKPVITSGICALRVCI